MWPKMSSSLSSAVDRVFEPTAAMLGWVGYIYKQNIKIILFNICFLVKKIQTFTHFVSRFNEINPNNKTTKTFV